MTKKKITNAASSNLNRNSLQNPQVNYLRRVVQVGKRSFIGRRYGGTNAPEVVTKSYIVTQTKKLTNLLVDGPALRGKLDAAPCELDWEY
jgi:hypothetical protein